MRRGFPTRGRGIALILLLIASFAGCEEVLEVCAPCGSVEARDVTISGDPRLDGTIEAVQRFRQLADESVDDFARYVAQLADAFKASSEDVSVLVMSINNQLFENPDLTVLTAYEPPRCWVNAETAEAAELSCEKRLGCVSPNATVSKSECVGLFVGDCGDFVCQGSCYSAVEDDEEEPVCSGKCMGTCGQISSLDCPGVCFGECSETCSAYNADGECFGYCPGLCTGACDARTPFQCGGWCLGLCETEAGEETGCAGTCRGVCTDRRGNRVMGSGLCRGHLWPGGVNEECSYCREAANAIAWSLITCEPPRVSIDVLFSEDFEASREQVIYQARTLENALARAAEAHAKLSLLVDGLDDAGEIQPADLVNLDDAEAAGVDDAGIAEMAPDYRPLASIKSRVQELRTSATGGSFQVAVGALSCVGPAFDEAYQIMDEMIPEGGEDPSNRACPDQSADALAPCLYETIDGQAALLDLVTPEN